MSKRTISQPARIVLRGEAFWEGIAHYTTSEGGKAVSRLLNESRHTIKEAGIAYRVANHWESVGLMPETRPEGGKGWRKFSTLDLVWLHVLTGLRMFGMSLEQLKKVKESLQEQYVYRQGATARTTFWEYHVAHALAHRQPTYLLVFRDGTAEPAYFEQYQTSLTLISLADHIHININEILQALFPSRDMTPVYEPSPTLTNEEFEAVFLLRTGNYDSITLKGKGGKIETIEAEETISNTERLTDILNDSAYQDVEIKRRDGKTVSVKRKILTKL
jgi:DNA-binding transcriptional MerR regulator